MTKFVHCADVHLDSPLRGLTRYEGAPVDALRAATRRAFERVVDLVIAEGAGALVLSGDLYDGNRDDFQTAVFFQRQLHRLREAGARVVVAYGNHDAESEITRRLSLPDNTDVLPTEGPGTVVLEDLGVAFHGRSYPTKAVDEDYAATYPVPIAHMVNVGVLHTSLDGRPGHARYAPCTVDGLVRRDYAYWALGHVHRREHIERDGVHVVFPGNVCGRDVGEEGPKGATVVEYDGDNVTALTHRAVAPVQWHRLEVDARGAGSADELCQCVLAAVGEARAAASAELQAIRVQVHSGTRAYGQWARDTEACETQLRADAAGGDGSVFLERIDVSPASAGPPSIPGDALAAVASTMGAWREGGGPGSRALTDLFTGVRARFGAEREAAIALGALGLDEESFERLLTEADALLAAELEPGA